MTRFALVILTETIKIKQFIYKDDFDLARQALVSRGVKFIPLKFYAGTGLWIQQEMVE